MTRPAERRHVTRSVAAVTIAEAARELCVSVACVNNWVKAGAPTVSQGRPGTGLGTRVEVAKLLEWRGDRLGLKLGGKTTVLRQVALGLDDLFRRDAGEGLPLHRSIGVSEAQAAALVVAAYQRIYRRVTGADVVKLPPELETLFAVCVSSSASQHRR